MIRYKIIPFFLVLAFSLLGQKSIPEPTTYLVNDYAGLMSRQEVVQLGRKLTDYAKATSTQIVVVTEKSLEGADLFEYTIDLAEAWKIGQGQEDNGVLIYVSEQDRKIQIQTGYGSEGFLPDIMAKRIIENIIKPAFRQNRYYEGLDQATTSIMQLGEGEYTNDQSGQTKRQAEGGIPAVMVIVFLLVLIVVLSSIGNRHDDDDDDDGGYYRGGRYDVDPRNRRRGRRGGGWIFFPFPGGFRGGGGGGSGGGGGGGFGGFGGGDFGGFGGGGFGGGGAWGEW